MKINNINQTTSFNGILRVTGSKKLKAEVTKQILDKVYHAQDTDFKGKLAYISSDPDQTLLVFATKDEVFKIRKFLSDSRKKESNYPANKLIAFYNENISKYVKPIPSLDAKDILKAREDNKFDFENLIINA